MTDDEFFAWLDGELPPAEAARIAAMVEADPALKAKAEQHRQMAVSLRNAFAPVATPAPERIGGAEVVAFQPRRAAANENRRGLPAWASLAATLAIGLVAGTMIPRGNGDPVQLQGGQMVAASALKGALDSQLASAGEGDVRIGLTFRDASGKWCRSFDGAAGAGLACRDEEQWKVRALFPQAAQGGDYRMAAGVDPRLAAVIDEAMTGDAADAAAERQARDSGWR